MPSMTVDVWLYGPLSRYGGDADRGHSAHLLVTLPSEATLSDLLAQLDLPTEERGITFINGDLSAMPGLQPDLDHLLHDGDRVALFHLKSMWPFQYRDGAALIPELADAMRRAEAPFHHRPRDT